MPPILGYITLAIAVVSFLGAAFVYLRGSADKGTIESQGRLIKAQADELADLTKRLTTAEARVATVEVENAVLRDAVGHGDELRALQSDLTVHHSESMAAWAGIRSAVERIAS